MSYKIRSSILTAPWFDKLVADTLSMYFRGEDLANSPLTKVGRKLAWRNEWHWTLFDPKSPEELESGLREREEVLIELYHSMKETGYNGSIVAVWFDKDGQVHLYDGFHRLAVMKYLGIEADINAETIWSCKDFDFPLVDTLMRLPRVGKCTYEPVDDERVKGFPVDRKDSPARLEYILKNTVGETVLDIGCSEGYFSREMAKRGYKVTAIDSDQGKVAVARYLSIINNLDVDCRLGEGEDFLEYNNGFGNVLYLSVFHNTIFTSGMAKAFLELRRLRGKAKRIFFEVPDGAREPQWAQLSAGKPLFHFKGKEFEALIEDTTGMKIIDIYHGFRPMMLLAQVGSPKPASFRTISRKEWREHNDWEKNWWEDCTNTYSEQVLQEMYAKYMKLDQFAMPYRYQFDLKGMSVVDIGGGPVSLLLRCKNCSRAVVVDPCDYPNWVLERYKLAGITLIKKPAEDVAFDKEFDEAWIYNCLQHVRDPGKLIQNAMASARKIRVFEPLEVGTHQGHPHNLSQDVLDRAFGKQGLTDERGGKPGEIYYFGVFSYV